MPPTATPGRDDAEQRMFRFLDATALDPVPYRWRLDLRTGAVKEEPLSDAVSEFGTINGDHLGRPYRYCYSLVPEPGWFLFRGLRRTDIDSGVTDDWLADDGVFVSEAPLAPRHGGRAEDDGYVVTFPPTSTTTAPNVWCSMPTQLAAGPIARVQLPERICAGTHSTLDARHGLTKSRQIALTSARMVGTSTWTRESGPLARVPDIALLVPSRGMTNTLNDQDADAGDATAERLEALEQDLQRYRVSRDAWTFAIFGIAILTAIASIVGIGLGGRAMTTTAAAAQRPAAAPLQADLSEFVITLSAGTIDVGGSIEVTNSGSQAHNLGVEGTDLLTPDIEPGGSATLDLSSLDAGTYTLYCDIAGHADSGMTTPLVIGGARRRAPRRPPATRTTQR